MIGSLIGGIAGMAGGNAAADQADWAAGQAVHVRNVNRADTSPWRGAGIGAVNQLARLLGLGGFRTVKDSAGLDHWELDQTNAAAEQDNAFSEWKRDPGYEWRLDQGIKARDRSAASKGMLLSGAQRKALDTYGQGVASEEYGNYFNRLAQMAGAGQQAVNQTGNVAAGTLGSLTSASNAGGQARQSAYSSLGKGISSGINNLAGFGSYRGWI